MNFLHMFLEPMVGYFRYLVREISRPHDHNYFYWLIAISLGVYLLEILFPWRKRQARIRRDFWLDAFYMFFNFFLFPLLGFVALSTLSVALIGYLLTSVGISDLAFLSVADWPGWVQLLTLFLVRDFVHFNVHRLLHRVPFLWEFHKVHHSTIEMGFAAHLRFHWMETVVYRTLEFLPLALIGFGIDDFLIVHLVALTIGHLNHANINLKLGPLKYLINSPGMHIWHHMAAFPKERPHGVNFGISLSLWDYLFATAYRPASGRDIELGFDGVNGFPENFPGQFVWPFWKAAQKDTAT